MLRDNPNPEMTPRRPRARYGQRLDADVYDPQGVLLLRRGKIVQERHWVPRLRGEAMTDAPAGPSKSWAGWGDVRTTQAPEAKHDDLTQAVDVASAAKQEATDAVASVFARIHAPEELDVSMLRSVVSAMVASLVSDPRALLSMALIKDADNYTHTHSVNVAILAMCLSTHIGQMAEAEEIGIGGLVHDIGKVEIPPQILHKPGTLTNAEAQAMRQHPVIGAQLLSKSGDFSHVAVVCARDHHETANGGGYPFGKRGSEISVPAQITAIADVYDALTTDRPYRDALLPEQALRLMTRNLANSFDPVLLEAFVGLIGYHPVGTRITLANGYGAVVMQNDPKDPARPVLVQAMLAPDGTPLPQPVYVDTRLNRDALKMPPANDAVIDKAVPLIMRELKGFDAFA